MIRGYNETARGSEYGEKLLTTPVETVMKSGFAWLDMVLNFQRQMQQASLQSFSSYSPTAGTTISGRVPQWQPNGGQNNGGEQVVAVGEERLNVATRSIPGETTRIRRRVVEQPVEQQVTLREEKVVVERRPATGKPVDANLLTETIVEMTDSREVPTVWKSLHVAEEVVLRKQVTERTQKVRETVRRDVVEIDHDRKGETAPDVFASKVAAFQEKAAETRDHLASLRPAAPGDEKPGHDKRAEERKEDIRHAASAEPPQIEAPKPGDVTDRKLDDAATQQARRKS